MFFRARGRLPETFGEYCGLGAAVVIGIATAKNIEQLSGFSIFAFYSGAFLALLAGYSKYLLHEVNDVPPARAIPSAIT